jgi:hypothetical protein
VTCSAEQLDEGSMLREICIVKKAFAQTQYNLELTLQLYNAHLLCLAKELDEGCIKGNFAEAMKQALPKPYTVVELTAFLVGNSFQFSTLLH